MVALMRRFRRPIAVLMLLQVVSGGRVVAACDACEHDRVFFSASLSFKALVKTAARQEWKLPTPVSLGERSTHYCAQDLELLRRRRSLAVVVTTPPSAVPVRPRPRPRLALAFKLPTDQTPVQPRHLHSKN